MCEQAKEQNLGLLRTFLGLVVEVASIEHLLKQLRDLSSGDGSPSNKVQNALLAVESSGLRKLGESGSGRQVYALDDARVVKVARNASGVEQNMLEAIRSLSHPSAPFLAKVEVADAVHGIWLVMERVSPLSSGAFERLTKGSFTATMDYVYDAVEGHVERIRVPSTFAQQLALFVVEERVDPVEIDSLELQWGLTRDGRPVLLDYGA